MERPKCKERSSLSSKTYKHISQDWVGWCHGTCMAASIPGLDIFIDDAAHNGSSRMNSEVYRNILSGRNVFVQLDIAVKHSVNITKFIGIMVEVFFYWPSQSQHQCNWSFYLLKRRPKGALASYSYTIRVCVCVLHFSLCECNIDRSLSSVLDRRKAWLTLKVNVILEYY